ncbi:hypothetical protein WA026_014183, partial [Henosepilachna vigintioctopunctata]
CVFYNNSWSSKKPVNIGDPQGFLGRFLTILLADDNTLSTVSGKQSVALVQGNEARLMASNWFASNRLVVNDGKSNSSVFLGVVLDTSLRCDAHTDSLASQMCRGVFLLRSLADSFSP